MGDSVRSPDRADIPSRLSRPSRLTSPRFLQRHVGSMSSAERGQQGQRRMSQQAVLNLPTDKTFRNAAAREVMRKISIDGHDPNSAVNHDNTMLSSPVVSNIAESDCSSPSSSSAYSSSSAILHSARTRCTV